MPPTLCSIKAWRVFRQKPGHYRGDCVCLFCVHVFWQFSPDIVPCFGIGSLCPSVTTKPKSGAAGGGDVDDGGGAPVGIIVGVVAVVLVGCIFGTLRPVATPASSCVFGVVRWYM